MSFWDVCANLIILKIKFERVDIKPKPKYYIFMSLS